MQEDFLHYIWQYRLYQFTGLKTSCGKRIQVLHPGNYNRNQGPDFLDARIIIGNERWAGHVELHIHASHWKQHGHSSDINYANVILHVVWKEDALMNLPFPTLELHHCVSKTLLGKYATIMKEMHAIPCKPLLKELKPLVFEKTIERMIAERMEFRSGKIIAMVQKERGDWNKVWLKLFAGALGGKVNGSSFEQMMDSIPIRLLGNFRGNIEMTEALLFGQANMLGNSFDDQWPRILQSTYLFIQSKYQINPAPVSMHYFRMRPSSFPGIRLAMLANYLSEKTNRFDEILNAGDLEHVRKMIPLDVSAYWKSHYRFDVQAKNKVIYSIEQIRHSCILNAIVPVLYAYGVHFKQFQFIERSIDLMEVLKGEKNRIIHLFEKMNLSVQTATQSQGLLQLHNEYCVKKNCLHCSIGLNLLKRVD